jgi:hypothetical protein
MRTKPILAVLATTVAVATGCSSGGDSGQSETPPPASSTVTSSLETHTAAPGQTGESSGGVTTAVGAPAESTEEEYSQACQAAKTWMAEKGGDPKAQFEPYLAEVQSSDSAGPGTFGKPWSQLPPARQAAVIVAAEAAANDLCG